jgi:hypothetical protein
MTTWLLRFEDGPFAGQVRSFDPSIIDWPRDEAPQRVLAYQSMVLGGWIPYPDSESTRETMRFDEERGMQPVGDRVPILVYEVTHVAVVDTGGTIELGELFSPGTIYHLAEGEQQRWEEYQRNGEIMTMVN